MKDIAYIERRLNELRDRLHEGLIPTEDGEGGEAWLEGSGLHLALEIMRIERNVGRQTELNDFPPELQEKMHLWSRAQLSPDDGQASLIVKDMCQQILAEGHR